MMLTELLPGVRELRSALAAGYLWLLLVWLWFHDDVTGAGGPIAELVELGSSISDVALAAIATFVAYLVGSVSEDIFVRWFVNALEKRGNYAASLEDEGELDVQKLNDPDLVREELVRLENSADRAQAEARLRVALVPPLLAIVIFLAFDDGETWLLGIIVVLALAAQATMRVRDWFIANLKLGGFRRMHDLIAPPPMGASS